MMRKIGARYSAPGVCDFTVWAPLAGKLSVRIVPDPERTIPMTRDPEGYFSARVDNIRPGSLYFYCFEDGRQFPDPVSYYQPQGVFGPSCVVDHSAFRWNDEKWEGLPVEKMIVYELHVGTFTEQGDFSGVIQKLDHLWETGVNAVEIMPVAQFPGSRNWGYDGVYPFAVQDSYGGPEGLKGLVNECHTRGMSVILDVVYNHLGPEGNFLPEFMPCFTEKYRTPWGNAINFDDARSAGVREFFIQNALYWFDNYHIDALRLDAVHGIFDMGAKHILKELSENVKEFSRDNGRSRYLIAESDLNDTRVVEPFSEGGYAFDAQWNDDFHHSIHTLLAGEDMGYYADFGGMAPMAKAVRDGFVYDWKYSPHRERYHGSPSGHIPSSRFVVFSQNHDQTGNRMRGERLSALIPFEGLKVAAGMVLLSSNVPLLFMGEEYGEEAPFLYFISFHDPGLIDAVREGRKKEFASFQWDGEPDDPFDEKTFTRSKLRWDRLGDRRHRVMLDFYKRLINIRKNCPLLCPADRKMFNVNADERGKTLTITRLGEGRSIYSAVNFDREERREVPVDKPGEWEKILGSSDGEWQGPGPSLPDVLRGKEKLMMPPLSLAVYERKT